MRYTLQDPELVPVDQLTPFPGNPRRGRVDVIEDSLITNGQYQPLICRPSDGVVMAGVHTLAAARRCGAERVAVQWVECDDEVARKINLADNRVPELGSADLTDLLPFLDGLSAAGQLAGTGYLSADEVDDLLAAYDVGVLAPQPFTGGYAEDDDELAARVAAAQRAPGNGTRARPFLLVMDAGEWQTYQEHLARLGRRWGDATTPAAVVLRAVLAAAEALP